MLEDYDWRMFLSANRYPLRRNMRYSATFSSWIARESSGACARSFMP
jgi:hypothetical protein